MSLVAVVVARNDNVPKERLAALKSGVEGQDLTRIINLKLFRFYQSRFFSLFSACEYEFAWAEEEQKRSKRKTMGAGLDCVGLSMREILDIIRSPLSLSLPLSVGGCVCVYVYTWIYKNRTICIFMYTYTHPQRHTYRDIYLHIYE